VNYKYATTLSLLSFLALTALHGADVPLVRGQIQTPKPELLQGLYAGLEEVVTRTQIHRVDIHGDGAFEFRGVPSGDYLLRVTDLHGDTVYQQFVTIQEHFSEIQVSLPDSGRTPVHPGKVSLTQLMHPPDKKAVQAFHTALRLSESGKYNQAASELERALQISPEFGQAYTNLAVQHMRLGQYEQAAAESRHAMQIGGEDPVNLCNLAYAQFQLHQYSDAETSSRAALRLDSGYLQGHLVLGSVLALNREHWDEAIKHLQIAARQFESAQKTLDAIHAAR
jgi:hypothetical protein